ncbi:hypothetical protein AS19_03090 [Alcanivorax sp. NBRC 101098]|uniref:bestrophin family protein n=1 Tax=Alcanivorax sp. NBRC 101098 TaxID=1113728 RepID=UPI0004ABE7C3|nr:bestrophin family ion channel [Alcanivorax sp. NBRC 101098]BAP13160.1 hypothetical protein AS19_03090 [Alcanivorax sp. NBRC 101098]
MIVRERPNAIALLLALRGSVVPEILPHIAFVALFSVAVAALSHYQLIGLQSLTIMPVTLLGIVLSILLGFRNNASYDRWWEARKQWGQMVNEIRSLARVSGALLGENAPARRAILMRALAYAHALKGQLREENVGEDLLAWVSREDCDLALATANPADAFIAQAGSLLGEQYRQGSLDSMGLRMLDERLAALSKVQAASERIATTPLPFAYTLLVHRTAYVYCYLLPFALTGSMGWVSPILTAVVAYTFFGIDRLSEHLETPFGRAPNDLPLDALCRIHEISVADALGDVAPAPLPVKNFQLQ